jgi:ArsR family transcriptional regulator
MDMAKVFKALGHKFRFQIFMALLQGDIHSCCGELRSYEQGCCVTDITDMLDISQSTVSHHLGILVDADIVKMEKRGLWSVYLISTEAIKELYNAIGGWLSLSCKNHQSIENFFCGINLAQLNLEKK